MIYGRMANRGAGDNVIIAVGGNNDDRGEETELLDRVSRR